MIRRLVLQHLQRTRWPATLHARACGTELRNVKVPTLEEAKKMPTSMAELSNETLIILAEQGSHDACTERLIRNVMSVDGIEWLAAKSVVYKITKDNEKVLPLLRLPYQVTILGAAVAGFGCIPMVFDRTTAKWFNKYYVTTEVPDPGDIDTIWEVGNWTWNWMEPPLGVGSFVLLSMQVIRAQMLNMDLKPYTVWVHSYRSSRLAKLYPQYNEDMVREFASSASLHP